MITWMQRHKKWLIITIWISTIAFVGAGFVGWGQYSYGDKAGAIAKVGDVEITQGELQKSYSSLYGQYSQMFQGNFDEEKAKQFGLQKQALNQLIQQALLLNLAQSYDLEINDLELIATLKTQDYFFKDGVFNKEIYKQVLSQNRLNTKEYEAGLKKTLLIQKTLKLLPVEVTQNEINSLNMTLNIADKINYRVLSKNDITIDKSDAALKPYWENKQNKFMTDISYDLKYIKQENIVNSYDDAKVSSYYSENKTHFKDAQGKILSLESAKPAITAELNAKATKDRALRNYIAYKKGKLDASVAVKTATISKSNNIFDAKSLEGIQKLSLSAPFMKPMLVNGFYYTFELVKINKATPKTFQEAKADLLTMYTNEKQRTKLQELANNSLKTFTGITTDFIIATDADKITNLDNTEAGEFLQKLFSVDKKRSYITLNSGKIVLYDILEQRLLNNSNKDLTDSMKKIKSSMFNEALMKSLKNNYKTEIYIQGL